MVTIPGAAFGQSGEGCLRLSFGSVSGEGLVEGLDRLEDYFSRRRLTAERSGPITRPTPHHASRHPFAQPQSRSRPRQRALIGTGTRRESRRVHSDPGGLLLRAHTGRSVARLCRPTGQQQSVLVSELPRPSRQRHRRDGGRFPGCDAEPPHRDRDRARGRPRRDCQLLRVRRDSRCARPQFHRGRGDARAASSRRGAQ